MKKMEPKDYPFCHCKARISRTQFAFGVECEENPLIHTMMRPIGEFETVTQAVTAWNFWVGNVETEIV